MQMSDLFTENERKVLRAMLDATGPATPEELAKATGMTEALVLKTLTRLHVKGYIDKPDMAELALSTVDGALRNAGPNAKCSMGERVLMASIMIGSGDEAKISALGLNPDEVRTIGDRLRSNGIWDAGGVAEPRDGIEFHMMCCVAEGDVVRTYDRSDDEWKYAMTPDGVRRVEAMPKKE
jgi:hypothetical protein